MHHRETHTVEVAGLIRHFPLFEVAPGVRIAIFNMLGDTYVVKAAAAALAEQLRDVRADVLVTAEAKSIPLIYEMSALMGLPYVVLRKSYKSYMGDVIRSETVSITTGRPQTLFLDEKDHRLIIGKNLDRRCGKHWQHTGRYARHRRTGGCQGRQSRGCLHRRQRGLVARGCFRQFASVCGWGRQLTQSKRRFP